MNSTQSLAQMIRGANDALGKAASELDDKMTWRPLDKGRSALDQVVECGGFAGLGAHIFTHLAVPPLDPSVMQKFRTEYDTPEKALGLLSSATDECARAIEALPAEKLDVKVTLPFGGGMEKTLAEFALMLYWNSVYHEGQVNYIQTLAAE